MTAIHLTLEKSVFSNKMEWVVGMTTARALVRERMMNHLGVEYGT